MPLVRSALIEIVLMVAAAAVLAALGPFDTYRLGGYAARLAYWVPATFAGYVIFRPLVALASWASRRLDLPHVAALAVGVLVAAAPATLLIAMLGGYRPGGATPIGALSGLYLNVVLIGALLSTLLILFGPRGADPPPPAASEARPTPAFFDRLPPAWNGRLIALEMEDHYVRAHGPGGRSVLILMRMADATRELGESDGQRVHRSWWVSRASVDRAVRAGRNWVLRLDGGLEAPVARDRVGELRALGWLGN